MATARIGANTGKELDVIAIDETKPSFGVELDELLNIIRIDATVTAAGLQVYPPNQTARQLIHSFTFIACPHKVYLHVYPVTPGIGVP